MLIPDNIERFDSHGEYILYLKFKRDKKVRSYYVLHSVFTNHHLSSISGELDFLVIAPNLGVFAIEVKHGGVERRDGKWYFTNAKGEITSKTKGPFRQVSDTMHSIRNFLLDTVKEESKKRRLSQILFGTGVAFTSMDSAQINFGPEAHSWQILTKEGLKELPISNYIETLAENWHREFSTKRWYETNASRPSEEECKEIVRLLRGDFSINYTEVNRLVENEKRIDEFTNEQFELLSITDFNKRCLIQGQAGTGKTVLAMEVASRNLANGLNVGLFCFNKLLGKKFDKKLTSDKISYAGTLHSFISKHVENMPPNDSEDYYYETLPFQFLIENEEFPEERKFDCIIIDEAQDLITELFLEVFNMILKGGVKEGKWVMFGDFSNQAIYLNDPEKSLQDLSEKAFFTQLPPLRINCRNTKKIAQENTLLTGIDLPAFTGKTLEGETIITRFPAKSKERLVVEEEIKLLIEKDIPVSKITLLTPVRFESTSISESPFIDKLAKKGLQIATIHSFKGLENSIIILFGFDEIYSWESKRLLYIGISRATQLLYIILNKELQSEYDKVYRDNFQKLMS